MKCLVFSDSHGNISNMREAVSRNRDAEVVFFLGDGLSDCELLSREYPNIAWLAVRGNCDFTSEFRGGEVKKTDKITLEGFRIVFTHGDKYNAKWGLDSLKYLALSEEADILLFGHTHMQHEEYVPDGNHPFYIFNPGSISGSDCSFGVMMLDKAPLLSHGKISRF